METAAFKIAYVRRRKQDRPTCPLCATPYWAGSTQGPITYYYPGCRCIVRNRKVYRPPVTQYVQRLLFGLLVLVCSDVSAQMPRAVVTGPKESATGDMIVLDASASEGLSRAWLLAVSPVPKSFLPVDDGLRCVFATGTPGQYTFALVVAGVNPNGGAAVAMATHTILVKGTVPDDPPPITPPSTLPDDFPPSVTPTACVYVYEKDQTAIPRAVQAAMQKLNAAGRIAATDLEADTTDGDGDVPEQYKAALTEARKAGLPCLVVLAGSRVVKVVKSPTTEQHVTEAVK